MDSNADPKQWGPHVWASMHAFALFADRDSERLGAFRSFLNDLVALLPCATCRKDYGAYLANHGMPSPGSAFEWTVDLHNYVNGKTGKPTMALDAARDQWTSKDCSYSCTEQVRPTQEPRRTTPYETQVASSIALLSLTVIVGVAVWYSLQKNGAGSRLLRGASV